MPWMPWWKKRDDLYNEQRQTFCMNEEKKKKRWGAKKGVARSTIVKEVEQSARESNKKKSMTLLQPSLLP
jgi:hypothetical protein